MQLLNGKKIAKQIRSEIKKQISELKVKPGLAVILIGADPASHLYVSLKEKACREVGINFEKFLFPPFSEEDEIIKKIEELNEKKDINGILVQLPLPGQNADKIIAAIDPNKDVDGFHPDNLHRLETNQLCLVSPVVLGVMRLIRETNEPLTGKKAALIMSKIFARPFRAVLARAGANVEIIAPEDQMLGEKTKNSDILIVAVGQPNFITGTMVKTGATVIDIGTSRLKNRVVGDVDSISVKTNTAWLAPVPGGVGPMTVAMLLSNTIAAFRNQQSSE